MASYDGVCSARLYSKACDACRNHLSQGPLRRVSASPYFTFAFTHILALPPTSSCRYEGLLVPLATRQQVRLHLSDEASSLLSLPGRLTACHRGDFSEVQATSTIHVCSLPSPSTNPRQLHDLT